MPPLDDTSPSAPPLADATLPPASAENIATSIRDNLVADDADNPEQPAAATAAADAADPSPPPPPPRPAPRPLVRRHALVVRLCHWTTAIVLPLLIASGLQIYNAYPRFGGRGAPLGVPNPWNSVPFPRWARLGGWLAGGLDWHFALAWPFALAGLVYVLYLAVSGEWRSLLFRPRDVRSAIAMQLYYLRLRREHPPQGKHNALQKLAYTSIVALGALSLASGFAIYKPTQLGWLTTLFGGFEIARYVHFVAVWIFVAFIVVHVALVLIVDPASLRAIVTGWYRGRFPSHD